MTRVVEESPASRAGLGEGDRILSINDKDVKQMTPNQVRSAINLTAKLGVKLDVWFENGERHIVTIKEGAVYPLPSDDIELPQPKK